MKYNKFLLLFLTAAIFFNLVGTSEATADYKVAPATACDWASDWAAGGRTTPPVGTIINPEFNYLSSGKVLVGPTVQTGIVFLNCPIIRDNTTDTNASMLVRVEVKDNSPTTAIGCSLSMYAPNGSIGYTSAVGSTGVSFAGGFKELVMTGLTTSVAQGVYGLSCALPPSAEMLNYYWREINTSDSN